MNELGNTEADVIIPELWRPKMLEARYAEMVVGKRVLSVDGDVSAKGDILHIPIEPTVTVNDVTAASGAVTNQALTPTESQLNANKWKECTIDVVDKTVRQSIVDLLTAFTPAFGRAIAAQMDADLTALYTDVTTNVVGSSTEPTEPASYDLLTSAVVKLLDLDVPVSNPNDISFCFRPTQWGVLKKIDGFNNANFTGRSVGGSMEIKVADLFGIPTYFTTKIVASGSGTTAIHNNLLFHRQAFAWGMQKNFSIERFARVRLSTPINGSVLYGVKTVRQNHACLIQTAQ